METTSVASEVSGRINQLAERLRAKRKRPLVVIVIGKGGVGKTTMSILLGYILSQHGKTLVVSLDQAKHLIKYLGLKKAHREVKIREDFYAMQFDIEREAKKFTEEYSELLKQIMPGLKVLNIDHIAKTIRDNPGFEEEIFLRYLEKLYTGRDYEYIVVDTPPTGVTLRILRLPDNYIVWIESLINLRLKILSVKYSIERILEGRKEPPRDPILDKLYELKGRYTRLRDVLTDVDHTGYIIVATPEPLPVYEAKTVIEKLGEIGAEVDGIIVNRVIPFDKAVGLGIHEIQKEALREVKELECDCIRIAVGMSNSPPDTLEKALNLLPLTKPI